MTATQTYQFTKTGIKWMPQIASHWKISRVKNYFTFTNEIAGDNYEDYKVLSLSVNGVIIRDMESGKGKFSLSMDLYQIVKPRSIVLCLFDMDVTPRIVGLCENLGIITNAYTSIFPKENVNEKFYYYFFLQQDYNKSLKAQGTGVRTTLTNTQFGAVKIPVPPFAEQTAIANYLDDKCKKISHFITKKQRFIELLKEQRQSVITKAITKGIKEDVNYKESKIEWLGKIPSHWKLLKLKYVGESFIGLTYSPGELVDEGEGILVLRSSNIQNGKYSLEDNVYVKKEIPEKLFTKKGDILLCSRNGSAELIGKNILIDEHSEGNTFGAFMTIFRSELNNYLYYFFNSNIFKSQTSLFATSTINQLTNSILSNMKIAFPESIDEQKEIIEFIKTETATIDKAIAKAEREIELIKEYKEAMIAEAVMGKMSEQDFKRLNDGQD